MSATAPAVPAAIPPKSAGDFPTWLPPMLVKELRQGMRTRGFVVVFVAFQVLMALLMMGAIAGQNTAAPGVRASVAGTINGFFWTLLTVQLLIVTPARALGSLQVEMDSRSLDLLLLTRLTAWRIVIGKWGSLVAQATLLLVAMLPYGIVRYYAGAADLVNDAKVSLALLGGCAVLTAAGLWGSGFSKVLRIVFVVAVIFAGQAWRPLMMSWGVPGGGGASSPFAGADTTMWVFDGALLLAFFLIAAVRRIAPPAENHAPLARALPLLALLALPVWGRHGWTPAFEFQVACTAVFAGLTCAVELASVRRPMRVHLQPWLARGRWGRFVVRFVLPGWPSAMAFTILMCLLAALGLQATSGGKSEAWALAPWLVTLGFGGLVFPALALGIFKRTAARSAASLYGLTLVAMSILAGTVAALAAAFPLKCAQLVLVARVLPVTGFWLTLPKPEDLSTKAMLFQGALLAAVLLEAGRLARAYWRHVAALVARRRSDGP
jgi:hypothetical protein